VTQVILERTNQAFINVRVKMDILTAVLTYALNATSLAQLAFKLKQNAPPAFQLTTEILIYFNALANPDSTMSLIQMER
jgi:hypothetical protein